MTQLNVTSFSVQRSQGVVLNRVNLTLAGGHLLGLLGPNGAGKTTLLKAMAGVLRDPHTGSIALDGQSVFTMGPLVRARKIAFLPQGTTASWSMPVRDIIALGRLPYHGRLRDLWGQSTLRQQDQEIIAALLRDTTLEHLADRPFLTLSAGEKARALTARMLAVQADVLLADEPAAHLDPTHQLRILTILKNEARHGRAVVVSLHDLSLAARLCDQVIVLDKGNIIASGKPELTLTDPLLQSVFTLTVARGSWHGESFLLPWTETATPQG